MKWHASVMAPPCRFLTCKKCYVVQSSVETNPLTAEQDYAKAVRWWTVACWLLQSLPAVSWRW